MLISQYCPRAACDSQQPFDILAKASGRQLGKQHVCQGCPDYSDEPPSFVHELRVQEGARIKADIDCGNEAFERLVAPMRKEIERRRLGHRERWAPQLVFCFGNHEDRLTRAISADPKLQGVLSLDMCKTPGFERHAFLEIVDVDGIAYSHYFQNQKSKHAIGGSIDNRLNKIGRSFVAGHEQGFLYGCRQFPGNVTRHGVVAGSFYLHDEGYRGPQANGEWRGLVMLNEVRDGGNLDVMPLSMSYLQRKYS